MPLAEKPDFNANSAGMIQSRPLGDFQQSEFNLQNWHA